MSRAHCLCFALCVAACGDAAPPEPQRRADRAPEADEAAVVDGTPIVLAAVEAEMRAEGIGPREALEALEARELLAAEAQRRGIGAELMESAQGETERAAVRALLDRIEAEHSPDDVPGAAVQEAYDQRYADEPLVARPLIENVEDELRAEVANRERLRALVELVARLEREHGVELNEAAVRGLGALPIRLDSDPGSAR